MASRLFSRTDFETHMEPPLFLQRRSVRELIKFSLVGMSSTAVDKGSLWLFLQSILRGAPWGISATLSYSLGVINGFLWNRHWTFRACEHGSVGEQFVRFLSTSVVGLLLNLGATRVLLSVVVSSSPAGAAPMPRQVIVASLGATPLLILWNFSASKFWAFRRPSGLARIAPPAPNPPGVHPERVSVTHRDRL